MTSLQEQLDQLAAMKAEAESFRQERLKHEALIGAHYADFSDEEIREISKQVYGDDSYAEGMANRHIRLKNEYASGKYNGVLTEDEATNPDKYLLQEKTAGDQLEEAAKTEEAAKASAGESTESTESTDSANKDVSTPNVVQNTDTNVFYIDVKVFLEGVQVPHSSASVSYGITMPPTCTVIIPAAAFLRDLPETTKVLIIFRDLLPDKSGEYKYRLLFDGEMSGLGYSIDANGANMTISAIHTSAYLTLMQIMSMSAAEYLYNGYTQQLGQTTFITQAGMTKVGVERIKQIVESKQFESMADIVYLILRNILEGYKDTTSVSRWYWKKLGNDAGGYKILDRIYGVSQTAKNASITPGEIVGGSSGGSSSGSANSGSSSYESQTVLSTGDKDLAAEAAKGIMATRIEGAYDAYNADDNGAGASIGCSQWNGANAKALLAEIPGGEKFLDKDLSNLTSSELTELRTLLNSSDGQAAQISKLSVDCQDYVANLRSDASVLTDSQCVVYATMWSPTSKANVSAFIRKQAAAGVDVNNLSALSNAFETKYYIQACAPDFASNYADRARQTLSYVQSLNIQNATDVGVA